jgi:hypothetical protein
MARDAFALRLVGNEVAQQAFVARMGAARAVEIDTGRRVLEDGGGLRGSAHGAAVTSLLEKTESNFRTSRMSRLSSDIANSLPCEMPLS